jgi:hypothetical protein
MQIRKILIIPGKESISVANGIFEVLRIRSSRSAGCRRDHNLMTRVSEVGNEAPVRAVVI